VHQDPDTANAAAQRQLADAERQFREAAASDSLLKACQRLKDAGAALAKAGEEADRARADCLDRERVGDGQLAREPPDLLVERARRAAQGIPRLEDLRQALFPTRKQEQEPQPQSERTRELCRLAEAAAAQEEKARQDYQLALSLFAEERDRLYILAAQYLKAERACQPAAASAPGITAVEPTAAEVWPVITKLSVFEGLEGHLGPR